MAAFSIQTSCSDKTGPIFSRGRQKDEVAGKSLVFFYKDHISNLRQAEDMMPIPSVTDKGGLNSDPFDSKNSPIVNTVSVSCIPRATGTLVFGLASCLARIYLNSCQSNLSETSNHPIHPV